MGRRLRAAWPCRGRDCCAASSNRGRQGAGVEATAAKAVVGSAATRAPPSITATQAAAAWVDSRPVSVATCLRRVQAAASTGCGGGGPGVQGRKGRRHAGAVARGPSSGLLGWRPARHANGTGACRPRPRRCSASPTRRSSTATHGSARAGSPAASTASVAGGACPLSRRATAARRTEHSCSQSRRAPALSCRARPLSPTAQTSPSSALVGGRCARILSG